jgi:hypothetical protein
MTRYLLDTNVVMRFCNPFVAAASANGITHLLTFNPSDFTGLSNIVITHPQELVTVEGN